MQPSECKHNPEMLTSRGNSRSLWITCLMCGCRWERLKGVGVQTKEAQLAETEMITQTLSPETTRCPAGHAWVLRRESTDGPPFWGCSEFPNCTHALVAKPVGKPKTEVRREQSLGRQATQQPAVNSEVKVERTEAEETTREMIAVEPMQVYINSDDSELDLVEPATST
eukprot:18377-Lingulodinium_polyedra.AAC.1